MNAVLQKHNLQQTTLNFLKKKKEGTGAIQGHWVTPKLNLWTELQWTSKIVSSCVYIPWTALNSPNKNGRGGGEWAGTKAQWHLASDFWFQAAGVLKFFCCCDYSFSPGQNSRKSALSCPCMCRVIYLLLSICRFICPCVYVHNVLVTVQTCLV